MINENGGSPYSEGLPFWHLLVACVVADEVIPIPVEGNRRMISHEVELDLAGKKGQTQSKIAAVLAVALQTQLVVAIDNAGFHVPTRVGESDDLTGLDKDSVFGCKFHFFTSKFLL